MKSVTTRISDFDDIDDIEREALLTGSPERSWIWFGLIVSLCLHITLCIYFYRTRFQSVDAVFTDLQQPMTFRVKNDDMSNVLPDKPKVDQADVTSVMNEIERSAAQTLSTNPNATREQSVLNDSSASGRPQPALSGTELATSTIIKRPNTFTSKLPGDSAGPNKKGAPGFSDLDQLLAQKGPLGSGTKLRMPDDQLFEYDSAALQSSAISQLQKLGTLIKRNPNATFTVEGYTDSFGGPEYNLELSQRRADSVKQYLVEAMR